MSKITFRADDDLIRQLDEFDDSKSEVLRDALREYLEADVTERPQTGRKRAAEDETSLDDLVADRIDALVSERLSAAFTPTQAPDINVNITLEGGDTDSVDVSDEEAPERKTAPEEPGRASDAARKTCGQCGENVAAEHVYCPNCGENTSKTFCECGEELGSDWAFCPACGSRTPAADVLDNS
ncbi:CopG family transcriptional regulator [Halobacteriales archaeon QS_8_65_32]|nr:MAG: CopG family transcriptional regulator [Halobacteriales archaeon QS_8_65_32]